MKLSLVHQPFVAAGASPWRLLDEQRDEIAWANAFLDAQRIRKLSLCSLRVYAYDLLHFARWWLQLQQPVQPLSEITESTLLRLRPVSTRAAPEAPAPDGESPAGSFALLVSLPLRV